MAQAIQLNTIYEGPECIVSAENDYMPDNHVTRVEFPDTKMILELRGKALDLFQNKVRSFGNGIIAVLTLRIPCNLEFLNEIGGLTIVAEGVRSLSEDECLAVARRYMEAE